MSEPAPPTLHRSKSTQIHLNHDDFPRSTAIEWHSSLRLLILAPIRENDVTSDVSIFRLPSLAFLRVHSDPRMKEAPLPESEWMCKVRKCASSARSVLSFIKRCAYTPSGQSIPNCSEQCSVFPYPTPKRPGPSESESVSCCFFFSRRNSSAIFTVELSCTTVVVKLSPRDQGSCMVQVGQALTR